MGAPIKFIIKAIFIFIEKLLTNKNSLFFIYNQKYSSSV